MSLKEPEKPPSTACYIYLCLLLTFAKYCDSTYCTVVGDVEGEKTSITCSFPEDITVHKHSVNIRKYDLTGEIHIPNLIFNYYWPYGTNKPIHNISVGFEFDDYVDNNVKLTIHNTTKEHAGLYICDYSAASLLEHIGCRLHVKGRKISCEAQDVHLGESINVKCIFNSDLTQTREDFFVYRLVKGKPGYEDVLSCNNVGKNIEDTICYVREGFQFDPDKDISSRGLTLHIPKAHHSHTAQYFCNTVPTNRLVSVQGCDIHVQERSTTIAQTLSFRASLNKISPPSSNPGQTDPTYTTDQNGSGRVTPELITCVCQVSFLIFLLNANFGLPVF